MERYLLFDSGCRICAQLAQDVERESGGWLKAHTLRDPAMLDMVRKAQPGWQWQPTLLEIEGDQINVATGPIMMTRVVLGVGPRRAWRIAKLVRQAHIGINHGRRQFLYTGGALLASLSLLNIPVLKNSLSTLDKMPQNWQTFHDDDFGFSLQYPEDWSVETKEQQPIPLIDDEAILKRLIFSSSPAAVYLDVWLTKNKTLAEWLTWYKETRLVEQMLTKTNATIAGKPAAVFLQKHQRDLMITYLSDGKYVYRLINWMTGMSSDLDIYWRMLNTFQLADQTRLINAEIPKSVKTTGILSTGQSVGIQANESCCNHYDASGNRFPCCGCNLGCCCNVQEGNCTWWVYYKFGYVPFTGNAGTWWGQAQDHPLWTTSNTPSTNNPSIAHYAAYQGAGRYGHVAYAANWPGYGKVYISEMDWCHHCDQTRDVFTSEPSQGWSYYTPI